LFIGRDGFIERPPAFYAELRRLFITKNIDSILRPWTLSESANAPDVSNYFSEETGIFTVPTGGLYHFFLTISVSKAKVKENDFFSNKNNNCFILFFSFECQGIGLCCSKWRTCTYSLDRISSNNTQ